MASDLVGGKEWDCVVHPFQSSDLTPFYSVWYSLTVKIAAKRSRVMPLVALSAGWHREGGWWLVLTSAAAAAVAAVQWTSAKDDRDAASFARDLTRTGESLA